MTNRTVKFMGVGYGTEAANISVSIDGNLEYEGDVTTLNEEVPTLPSSSIEPLTLFTAGIPVDFTGTKSISITVRSGTVIFSTVDANYCWKMNSAYQLDVATFQQQYNANTEWLTTNFNNQWARIDDFIRDESIVFEDKIPVFEVLCNPPLSALELATLRATIDNSIVDGYQIDAISPVIKTQIIRAHNAGQTVSAGPDEFGKIAGFGGEACTNVYVDGSPVAVRQSPYDTFAGDWWHVVCPGSTLSYTLNVAAGGLPGT